ncbi:MAG: membrane-bound PQQ-dependent dehydrogenase, glucose/quinate/shikimate family [Hyphomicrobiaceae bacterium]
MNNHNVHVNLFVRLLGIVLLLIGLPLLVGGAYLVSLGGSWYYVLAGIGIAVAGVRVWQGRIDGLYLYLVILAGTVVWNFYEVGFRFWASVPRLAALLAIGSVLLLSARLFPAGQSLRPAKLQGAGLALLAVFAAYIGAMFYPHGIVRNDVAVTPGKETELTLAMGKEWRAYGRTGEGVRYSPLDQITPANVGKLEVVWTARHGQVPDALKGNADQNTPIYADGTVYHCAYNNVVTAVDGTTGKMKWQHNPQASAPIWMRCRSIAYVDPALLASGRNEASTSPSDNSASTAEGEKKADIDPVARATGTNTENDGGTETADANAMTRNANVPDYNQTAVANDTCGPRIVMATNDGRLMSIRTSDGKLCTSFGQDGVVDLHRGMGAYPAGQYMPTTGATLAKGKIVIGGWVMDNQSVGEAPGVVRAFDALTGELEWAWDPGNPEITKLPPEGKTYTRGTPNVWAPPSYDPKLNMVYLPTGNATPDYWGGERREHDDKYSSSVVALNLDSGKVVWHFQTVHHDLWDYDVPAQPALVDFPKADGTVVPALVQITKRGQIFVLDRRDGKPLTEVTEQPVPQGNMKGERYSPTQPFSTGMPQIGTDDSILDEKHTWGMTPLDHLYCRIRTLKTKWDGLMTPPSTDVYFEYPAQTGGMNWGSASFDQSRNLLVVNDMRWINRMYLIPEEETGGQDMSGGSEGGPMRGTPYQMFIDYNTLKYLGTPCYEPPYGTVTAINMATQKIKWQIPMGTTQDIGPFGLATGIPFNTGMPTLGGLLTTKAGVSFFAATQDFYLRAINTETGDVIWKDRLPVGSQSVPITYVDGQGRQIILVQAAGARHNPKVRGDYLIAYALKK